MAGRPIRKPLLVCALALACAWTGAVPATAPADVMRGSPGPDVLTGTSRADAIRGQRGADILRGRGGHDLLSGGRGKDVLDGGRGRDRLYGGPGGDTLLGGSGRDVLRARDGLRDRISCGKGRDRAVLDARDLIADATPADPDGSCESVSRPGGADAFLVAAGDIADCSQGASITAGLLDSLPGTIATLGDTVYPGGAAEDFARCYEPTWGRHKARTRPAAGNHDYITPGASGYFGYFGAAAGEPSKGYYSYGLGAWHVVVLNTNCTDVGGCGAGSPQERWLRADLTAHPARCTLAYWHHPRFSSGNRHGGSPLVVPLFRALRDNGVELLLSGHDHDYERFAPQTADGAPDPAGVRQFVVGTGGAGLRDFAPQAQPQSEVRIAHAYGLLRLRLSAASYEWQFVAQPGNPAHDSGRYGCS